MNYSADAHRRMIRARLAQLVTEGGPAWFDYALDQARKYEKEDPTLHSGLAAHVRNAIKANQPKEPSHAISA
jgi:hypothetical protein